MKRRFLSLALIDVLFLIALGVLGARYHGHVHPAGNIAIAVVLAVFCVSSGYGLLCAFGRLHYKPEHLDLAIAVCPMIALMATVSGFLIAFSGGTEDVQQRVLGASTGLSATFVGIACAVVLMAQAHILHEPKSGCACR